MQLISILGQCAAAEVRLERNMDGCCGVVPSTKHHGSYDSRWELTCVVYECQRRLAAPNRNQLSNILSLFSARRHTRWTWRERISYFADSDVRCTPLSGFYFPLLECRGQINIKQTNCSKHAETCDHYTAGSNHWAFQSRHINHLLDSWCIKLPGPLLRLIRLHPCR